MPAEVLRPGDFGMGEQSRNDRVSQVMRSKNRSGRRPLTPFERKQIEDGEQNPYYIYNVSPIHEWHRPQGQLGTIHIPKRKWGETISIPAVIRGVVVRWVKKSLQAEDPFIEGGLEIAMDICGVSERGDVTHPNSNLTKYGVVISDKPFDVEYLPEGKRRQIATASSDNESRKFIAEFLCPKSKQKEIIAEANQKLLAALQERILEADNWHNGGPEARKFIHPFHRECLRAFIEITGRKETRPWAEISMGETLESCPFCTTQVKPGTAKCPTCHEIINNAAYEQLKKDLGTTALRA